MGRNPERNVWFVGDGIVDAEAAKSAGVQFAWASYGYESVAPQGVVKEIGRFEDILVL